MRKNLGVGLLFALPWIFGFLIFLASLPGVVLVALSILAFLVSLLALLLLTVPLYRLQKLITGGRVDRAKAALLEGDEGAAVHMAHAQAALTGRSLVNP